MWDLWLLRLTSDARPTNGIWIEFEILSKLGVLQFTIYLTNHNKILHTSGQLHCRDMCKIMLWSVEYIFKPQQCKFLLNFEFDENC